MALRTTEDFVKTETVLDNFDSLSVVFNLLNGQRIEVFGGHYALNSHIDVDIVLNNSDCQKNISVLMFIKMERLITVSRRLIPFRRPAKESYLNLSSKNPVYKMS